MKKYAPLLVVAAALFLSSCADEDAAEPITDDREKFLGDWKCDEQITPSSLFTISIRLKGDLDTVLIDNFSNYGATALGIVNGNDLIIPAQSLGAITLDSPGSGILSGTGGNQKITLNYTIDSQNIDALCTRP